MNNDKSSNFQNHVIMFITFEIREGGRIPRSLTPPSKYYILYYVLCSMLYYTMLYDT